MRNMTKRPLTTLNTVEEVVAVLGGTKAASEWTYQWPEDAINMPAISKWISQNKIPPGWSFLLDPEMRKRGFLVDPRLYKQGKGRKTRQPAAVSA